MMEAINMIEEISGKELSFEYVDENRVGDHICYITDLSKFKKDYPNWKITKSIRRTITEIIGASLGGVTTERYIPGDGGDSYFENYATEIEKLAKGDVLDIGCGRGYLTCRIAENENVECVLGTDITDDPREEHPKITYVNYNTEDLVKSLGAKRDTIVSTEHIEHLPENLQLLLLEWIRHSLSDDGIFLGSMPHPDDPNNPNPYHLKTYSYNEWDEILSRYFTNYKVNVLDEENYWWWAKK
jgi:2-polyprenyl-3-methyl-5-hydroxy-6-metoxy-1,4-benzoquinol methylase